MTEIKKNKRVLTGTVVSDKGDKTVTVLVLRKYKHPLYKKMVTARKRYLAHDKDNSYQMGDHVRIQECAPISKRKMWFVKEKVEKK